MTTTSPRTEALQVGVPASVRAYPTGTAATRGAAAPALPAGHDRCTCTHLASEHDIGARRGVKVRTACSRSTCNCRTYQPAETTTEVTR